MSEMRRVEITWIDIHEQAQRCQLEAWIHREDIDFEYEYFARTLGYEIQRDDKYIWIAGTLGMDGDLGCVHQIPLAFIKSIKVL